MHVTSKPQRPLAFGSFVIAALALCAGTADAQYSYVRIDVPGSLSSVYAGTLNNSGVVSFTGFLTAGGTKIYKGSGGALTTIAATGAQFTFFNAPFINTSGDVGFRAIAGTNGAFRGNGGAITPIYSASNGVDATAIDDTGTVVWIDNSVGVMTGSGGATTTVVPLGSSDGLGDFFQSLGLPDISAGTVAFPATLQISGNSAIYTKGISGLSQVAVAGGAVSAVQLPRINALGSVVWVANLTSGNQAIMRKVGGVVSTFVDTTGPYSQFGFYYSYDINVCNQIVFSASRDGFGGTGIYAGPNPLTDRVIGPGDVLAGKTVNEAILGGLNDNGQVSFAVMFSDFTFAMFRADPQPAQPAVCPTQSCPPSGNYTDRAYRFTGNPNGAAWSWRISGPSLAADVCELNVPGVLPGAFGFNDVRSLTKAFEASVDGHAAGLACSVTQLDASASNTLLPVGPSFPAGCSAISANSALLTIRVGESSAQATPTWTLFVGPPGCVANCPVNSCTNPCTFNPDITEIPLSGNDCNDNGLDDNLDLLLGTSVDLNGDGIPDECPGSPCSPNSGSCFEAHKLPGCDVVPCCESTCELDPFCCDVQWDQACVELAGAFCVPPTPGDLNGDFAVNGQDLGILLGSWGTPKADINGDGNTDGNDLAILLGGWTG